MLLMRHAESVEDVNKAIYDVIPDFAVGLTPLGQSQAMDAAAEISHRIGVSRCLSIYYSPARRAEQTAEIIAAHIRAISGGSVDVRGMADARLLKQNWGSVTVSNRLENLRRRSEVGALNYRLPDGESGWDVAARMQSFIDELAGRPSSSDDATAIVTHGFEMRIALMVLLRWTASEFEQCVQPTNCFIADVRPNGNMHTTHDTHRPQYTLASSPTVRSW